VSGAEDAIDRLVGAFSDGERRRFLAERGRLVLAASAEAVARRMRETIAADRDGLLHALRHHDDLERLWRGLGHARYPGRSEALLALARALSRPLPPVEHELPELTLEVLLERVERARGQRVPVRGASGHKGRVGDGVERLLVGAKVPGRESDHPAAEIKSVPVRADRVIERVKLGVISARSNPLDKCRRILFVFVEQRGRDHFVCGHRLCDFDHQRWTTMWQDHHLVETAAGSPQHPARGLYLTPSWFYSQGLWPPR
jgi:hypothetical protein